MYAILVFSILLGLIVGGIGTAAMAHFVEREEERNA